MSSRILFQGGTFAVLATAGLPSTLGAAQTTDPASTAPSPAWHAHGGGAHGHGMEGSMLQVLHELNLTEAQKQQIRTITSNARAQWRSQAGSEPNDVQALGNPADPSHAAAVQAAQARAAQRIQNWSEVEQQVYTVLSPAQQAQLPQLLAELQTKLAARRHARLAPADAPAAP
jgi:Spy/CpxP family protein refolding chaperone